MINIMPRILSGMMEEYKNFKLFCANFRQWHNELKFDEF
ncbi:Hypothetical protein AKI40_1565 [Enterobacter sp. FY-07]|nr:Hypothetical protein AKI40_1565 [Enterobacter sp. FY-07]